MATFHDGPAALVTERVLVVRGYPQVFCWIDRISAVSVVGHPLHRAETALLHSLPPAAVLVVACLLTRRPLGCVFGVCALMAAVIALVTLRRYRPRLHDLRARYDGQPVVLVTSTRPRELVCVQKAISAAQAFRQRSANVVGPGDSVGRAA
jgi:hypothetical protein